MKRLVAAAALFVAGLVAGLSDAGPSFAQEACLRPVAPVFPAATVAGTLGQPQIEQNRAARDTFFTAADANLSCLDRTIQSRMSALFASGAPMDAELRRLGAAHEDASRERAQVYERFLRLCMAWEDAHHTPLPGGCAPAS